MKNLQEIIDRYKDQLPEYHPTVTGFLGWGGKQYYKINSKDALNINATHSGFITDENGNVEEYVFNPHGTKSYFKSPLSDFYPHPYFPDKQPIAIEVIRIMPEQKLGQHIYPLNSIMILIAMKYPEFFKPIY